MSINKFLRINEKLNLKNKKINFVKIFNNYIGNFEKIIIDNTPVLLIKNSGSNNVNGYYDKVGTNYINRNGITVIHGINGIWYISPFMDLSGNYYKLVITGKNKEPWGTPQYWTTYEGEEPHPDTELFYDSETIKNIPKLKIENENFSINESVENYDKVTVFNHNEKFEYFNISIIEEMNITENKDYLLQINYEENEQKELKQDIKFKEINLKKLY